MGTDGRSERSAAAAAPRARGLPLVAGPALESERELSLRPHHTVAVGLYLAGKLTDQPEERCTRRKMKWTDEP